MSTTMVDSSMGVETSIAIIAKRSGKSLKPGRALGFFFGDDNSRKRYFDDRAGAGCTRSEIALTTLEAVSAPTELISP